MDLLNINTSHPGLRYILETGAFTVRRTDNSFARCPVDITLEQTVNVDAASRLTGIVNATNNFSARNHWMATQSARAMIASQLLNRAGMF